MAYTDGFIIAVPNANRQQFIDYASRFDTIFLEFGATRVVECWADDVPAGKRARANPRSVAPGTSVATEHPAPPPSTSQTRSAYARNSGCRVWSGLNETI